MANDQTPDVERLLDAVHEAARTVSARFVTFVSVGAYIALTIASTTDEMLVKGSLVRLPLLNTEIPITGWFGFYTLAPWLLVMLHLDRMLQLSILSTKLGELDDLVRDLDRDTRERVRARLPTLHYVQFFAADASSRLESVLAGAIVCGTMIVFPLALLCWIQMRFLALHDPMVTLSHRLAVMVDVVFILLFLWSPLALRDARRDREVKRAGVRRLPTRFLVIAACGLFFVLSILAGIPDDMRQANTWIAWRNLDLQERILTPGDVSAEAINALKDGDVRRREQALNQMSRQTFLQGRDLRNANFYNAILPRLDLRSQSDGKVILDETELQGANLQWSQMQQVLLDDANLREALLCGAQLQGAELRRTKLEDAKLDDAQLQQAILQGTLLNRASLPRAKLQGADLTGAVLQEANLSGAQLQGADLRGAQLQRADLSGASLQGADLTGAQLEGAKMRNALLQGAVIDGPGGADFDGACLDLTALAGQQVGRCCDAAECASPNDGERYENELAAHLVRVACADAYAARGIARRALWGPKLGRKRLIEALIAARDPQAKCDGVRDLPDGTVRELVRVAATTAAEEGPLASVR